MNKGLKLIHCKKCKRKRFCSKVPVFDHNWKWTCSKGHSWIEIGMTLHRINNLWNNLVMPKIKDLFDRDATFYKMIKK